MHISKVLAGILALGLFYGCSGGSSSSPAPAKGTVNLYLGADHIPGYSQVVVSVEKVEWSPDGTTWGDLGSSVKGTYDLAALENGNGLSTKAFMVGSVALNPTTMRKLRITWATTNFADPTSVPAYLVPLSGPKAALAMPTTTVIDGPVVVASGTTVQTQIMLAGAQAVQNRGGSPASYSFQATGRFFDTTTQAKITGHLSAGTTNLSGVEVYAETVVAGVPVILRRSLTDASGNYVLDGLATGSGLTYVVAQPAGSPTAYAAQASAPLTLASAMSYSADLSFGTAQTAGNLNLVVTPASTSSDGTWAELRQFVAVGSLGGQNLIVRSVNASTATSQDQFSFAGLAPGIYDVTIQRSTSGAAAKSLLGTNQQLVSSGNTTSYSLSFP